MLPETDTQGVRIQDVVSELLGQQVVETERLPGGRNSRIYKLTSPTGGPYVAKLYHRKEGGQRDRLEAEFSGLQFLWKNGVRCVPQPIAADRDHGCAVYGYIEGHEIPTQDVTTGDIDYAVEFLATLDSMKDKDGSRELSEAAEACFSVQAIVDNLQFRLDVLNGLTQGLNNQGATCDDLRKFLASEFIPAFQQIKDWSAEMHSRSGAPVDLDLPVSERTLSPSDFGFHNAVRCDDGQIFFVDFEYFGWDDPAKMVSDFLLHPAMELGEDLKLRFAAGMLDHREAGMRLRKRVEVVYPLFALKWCLIFLNEFTPSGLERRRFAAESELNEAEIQAIQLNKSRSLLCKIKAEYERFPYSS